MKMDEKDAMVRSTQTTRREFRDKEECEEAICKQHCEELNQNPRCETSLETRLANLEEGLKKQQEKLESLKFRLDVINLGNYDIRFGLKRPLVAYGIIEFIHKEYLTFAAPKFIKATTLKASTNLKNRCLKFFDIQIFNGNWQLGTYEELLEAWLQREEKAFSCNEIYWIESALSEGEKKFQANEKASDILRGMPTMDLRRALASAFSVESAAKRSIALHFLNMGDKVTRRKAVDDLLSFFSSGRFKKFAEVAQIMICGCHLYLATL